MPARAGSADRTARTAHPIGPAQVRRACFSTSVTEAAVSVRYGVARPTAKLAIERLVADGLLTRTANRAARALKTAAASLLKSQSALGAYYRRMCARLDKSKAIKAMKQLLVLDYEAAISLHPVIKGKPEERRAERLGSRHRLWLNGALLHDSFGEDGVGRAQALPLLLQLPPALLRPGGNQMLLQVDGGLRAGLSALRRRLLLPLGAPWRL